MLLCWLRFIGGGARDSLPHPKMQRSALGRSAFTLSAQNPWYIGPLMHSDILAGSPGGTVHSWALASGMHLEMARCLSRHPTHPHPGAIKPKNFERRMVQTTDPLAESFRRALWGVFFPFCPVL